MDEEKEIKNDFIGYSLFNDVEYNLLQAYNRCCVIRNIKEAHGRDLAQGYIEELDIRGKFKVAFMFNYIKLHGWEAVNAEVTKNNNNRS